MENATGRRTFVEQRSLQFGHFQDFFRVSKSLLSKKAERDLGSWQAPARMRAGGTHGSRPAATNCLPHFALDLKIFKEDSEPYG
jgi:hypothetical protein